MDEELNISSDEMIAASTLREAIDVVGGKSKMARCLRISPAFIGKIAKSGKIPPTKAREIEYLTKGAVTAEELLPHVFKPRWSDLEREDRVKNRAVRD